MPNEEKGRALVDLSALAKILPVEKIYDDLLARGVQQAGAMLEDLMKNIRFALPGVQLNAVDQDRFRKAIEDPYFRVPAERRTLPAAQLVGKVLEGIRYEPEGTPLRRMFEELLQRGCDNQRIAEAHPAFAGIIGQLSYDEAALLQRLRIQILKTTAGYTTDFQKYIEPPSEEIGAEFQELQFPQNLLIYANHLEALGLLNSLTGQMATPSQTGKYRGYQRVEWHMELGSFGKMFCQAVL